MRSGLPTLADDSGLEVDALGGGPGVFTRRYSGPEATDASNNAKLLRELAGLPPDRRGARYVCVLALALPGDTGARGGLRILTRRGTCRGRIATGLRGDGGFGYDPLFEPPGEPPDGRTLGQWSAAEKHAVSHRSRAARRMVAVAARSRGGVIGSGYLHGTVLRAPSDWRSPMFRHKDDGHAATPNTYQMHQRTFSIGDDFWIENGAGQRVFKVDGKALRIRKTLELQDGAGRELYKIDEKLATIRDVMTIEGRVGSVATVKKALFTPLHERYEIDFEAGGTW